MAYTTDKQKTSIQKSDGLRVKGEMERDIPSFSFQYVTQEEIERTLPMANDLDLENTIERTVEQLFLIGSEQKKIHSCTHRKIMKKKE